MRGFALISTLVITSLLFLGSLQAQDKKWITLEDAVLKGNSTLAPERMPGLSMIKGTDAYAYVKTDGEQKLLVKGQASGNETTILSLKDLNKTLGPDDQLTDFPGITWLDANSFWFSQNRTYYAYDLTAKASKKLVSYEEKAANIDFSQPGSAVAYTIDNNLYVATATSKLQVTNDSDKGIVNGQAVHRYEFGVSTGIFWSPNGSQLAFYRMDETMVTDYPLVDMTERPAALNNIKYPMAGMASHHVTLGVFDVKSGKTVFMQTGEPKEHYLTNIAWGPDGKYIYIAEINRDQNHVHLNQYDAATGVKVKTLFEEKHDKYVEPKKAPLFIPGKNNEFIWQSERDGWDHLYHYNTDGKLIRQLTKGEWVVMNVDGFSTDGSKIVFDRTGHLGVDQYIASVEVATATVKQLTPERGFHSGIYGGGNTVIDVWSSVDVPRMYELIGLDASKKSIIKKSDDPLTDYKIAKPEVFTVAGADGTPLNARLIKPYFFKEGQTYPVLVYVYGGPGVQMVRNTWGASAPMWMYYMANRGYLVFTVDSRGSDNRGRDFEQATFRNLGKVELADQLAGVNWLKEQPFVDVDLMAVHGWSYGGFMTTNIMLNAPDVFKVGVAGGPVMDWKYYEVMYTERYMDTPETNPDGFAQASMLDKTKKLQGKLLLIHGSVDDVVVPQHSMDFLKHCIEENVQVDFFMYPGHPHNVRGKDRVHLMEKVLEYIHENIDN